MMTPVSGRCSSQQTSTLPCTQVRYRTTPLHVSVQTPRRSPQHNTMSAVTANVTALSAKVSLSGKGKSRVQRVSARGPVRATGRVGFVCKAEVTNGNGTC